MKDDDERRQTGPVRFEIRKMKGYSVPDSEGLVKLDAMENPYPLSKDAMRRISEMASDLPLNRYPDMFAQGLKRLIRLQASIPDTHQIILGNGSDELIQMLITACCGGMSEGAVMGLAPSFVMYEQLALVVGAQWHESELDENFRIDVERTVGMVEKVRPRLLFVASPNNPTGNLFHPADMEKLAKATAPSGWLVLDEAYLPYSDPKVHGEYWKRLSGLSNVMFMRTFSKLGLAGIRLGYLVGHADEAAQIEKVRLPYNINVFTQAAAHQILQDADMLNEHARMVIKGREELTKGLQSMPGLKVHPSHANFLLVEVPSADSLWTWLREKGILVKVMKRTASGRLGSHLRITVGTDRENEALMSALADVMRETQ